jgi:hypothetical protein
MRAVKVIGAILPTDPIDIKPEPEPERKQEQWEVKTSGTPEDFHWELDQEEFDLLFKEEE